MFKKLTDKMTKSESFMKNKTFYDMGIEVSKIRFGIQTDYFNFKLLAISSKTQTQTPLNQLILKEQIKQNKVKTFLFVRVLIGIKFFGCLSWKADLEGLLVCTEVQQSYILSLQLSCMIQLMMDPVNLLAFCLSTSPMPEMHQ